MSEEEKTEQSFIPGPWSPGMASKKVGWSLGLFATSVSIAPTLSPLAVSAIDKISSITYSWGIVIVIDKVVFDRALPFLIFAALVAGHDYAKVKTRLPWL